MTYWGGFVVIVLAIIVLVLYRLITDRDPRYFPREDPEEWKIYSTTNAIVFAFALLFLYFAFRLIRWTWAR